MRHSQSLCANDPEQGDPRPDAAEQIATAEYIGAVAAELATLARCNRLGTLAYLLDMARLEADSVLSRQ